MDAIDYFGVCPLCAAPRNDGYFNIGRVHWFVCHAHRVKWCAGENLFRSWRYESDVVWQANLEMLAAYTEVESILR